MVVVDVDAVLVVMVVAFLVAAIQDAMQRKAQKG
jgi:hypothetical protein